MCALQSARDSRNLQSRTAPVREPFGLTGLGLPEANQVRTWRRSGPGPQYTGHPLRYQRLVPEIAAGTLYEGFSPSVSGPPEAQSCVGVQTGAGSAHKADLPGIGGSFVWACIGEHEAPHAATVGLGSILSTYPPEIPHDSNHKSDLLIFQKAQANYARALIGGTA